MEAWGQTPDLPIVGCIYKKPINHRVVMLIAHGISRIVHTTFARPVHLWSLKTPNLRATDTSSRLWNTPLICQDIAPTRHEPMKSLISQTSDSWSNWFRKPLIHEVIDLTNFWFMK
jgi:hypothetical protein